MPHLCQELRVYPAASRGTQPSLVGAPGHLGTDTIDLDRGLVCWSLVRVALTCGHGGWVGITTEPWGCSGGRPRPAGTPVPDETASAGCPRNYPVVPIPAPRPAWK
ncbi:hypothetical protein GCM10023320_59890 [Pseudonocardia adelaidensis]|uniref:Uncharacterized protein n=1 Tax=Pseudonocardia adelaidensis TaxID=648754 RepID=A0ABP9NT01_9PSEU